MMTPDEILEIDAQRNHAPGTKAGNLRALINKQVRENNGQIVQQGNTLILFANSDGDADVEYHCFNADTPQNLAANVIKFFGFVKKLGYKTATTPYDNPKISELFKQFLPKEYKLDIKRKGDQFEAKVRL
jgi:RNA recognition motif-containing protein